MVLHLRQRMKATAQEWKRRKGRVDGCRMEFRLKEAAFYLGRASGDLLIEIRFDFLGLRSQNTPLFEREVFNGIFMGRRPAH